jgi:hypothetical protein
MGSDPLLAISSLAALFRADDRAAEPACWEMGSRLSTEGLPEQLNGYSFEGLKAFTAGVH